MLKTRVLVLVVLVCVKLSKGTPEDQECPEDCECHYFRINWVTDCSENNFTEIPHEGLSLNIYILNMNSNNITEVQPFPKNIRLRRLQVADNFLTSLSQESFAGLSHLVEADFSGNRITKVDPNAFRDSHGMITLELQENPLDPVEGPFLSMPLLLYLDVSYCQISRMTPQFFINITSLNKLDLSGNPLGSIENGILDPLQSLEELKLNNCNLSHIDDEAFRNLTNLKSLELTGNYLSTVHWSIALGKLALLNHLDLRNSTLNYLPKDAFDNNNWLRSLVLAENELHDLDVGDTLGQNLHQLSSLDLTNCHLKGPLTFDAFANATDLRILILSGNSLSPGDLTVALAPLVHLHKLSLRNCGLKRLPPNTFHRLIELEELDISMNPLNDAFTGLLSPLETLEVLDMSYSNLSHISRGTFSKMNQLKHLKLSGNKLTNLESGLFMNLTHLRTLELNNCGLDQPPKPDVFGTTIYENFEELHMSGNPLDINDTVPLLPRQLSNLQVLDISNCNIDILSKNAFMNTPNITKLKLSGNLLGSVSDDMDFITGLPHLETLDVSNCKLKHFSPNVFSNNPNITSLTLVGNPWKCDCYINELWQWALNKKGNLSVLVGAITAPEDIRPGSGKRKKGLLCSYDVSSIPSPKVPSRITMRDFLVNKPWARYLKESDCSSSHGLKAERYTAGNFIPNKEITPLSLEEASPTWLIVVTGVLIFACLVVVLGAGRAVFQRRSKTRYNDSCSRTALNSDNDQFCEITTISKRRNSKDI